MRLPRLIGHARAMDLILTGRPVGGPEALAVGLANRLVAPGRALEAAVELAAELAASPRTACAATGSRPWSSGAWTRRRPPCNEARRGREVIASGETLAGARRFAAGAGRGGASL